MGVPGFLDDLRAALKDGHVPATAGAGTQDPQAGRVGEAAEARAYPAIADRVVQAALKLVLEPIFEADFRAGLLRVPAQAACPGRDRRDPLVRHPRLPLGAGRGHRGGLRQRVPLAP